MKLIFGKGGTAKAMSVLKNASNILRRKNGKKKSVASRIGMIALVVFMIYAVVLMISTEAEMNEQEAVLAELKDQITAAKQENDEYQRILGGDDENAYMEMIAIEKLGYAYPNEKRFYIKEGN